MSEYEQKITNIIIYSFAGLITTIVVIGCIVGLILGNSQLDLWKSLLLLISGACLTILKEAAAAVGKRVNKPPPEEIHKDKTQKAKNLAKELPEDYRTKVLRSLWKLAPQQTKESLSRSDSEESMSKKITKESKTEINE